ncbi:hypothetical protein Bca4012_007533 [Brassica carinata]
MSRLGRFSLIPIGWWSLPVLRAPSVSQRSRPSFRWLGELCWSPWPTEASREFQCAGGDDTWLCSDSYLLWLAVVFTCSGEFRWSSMVVKDIFPRCLTSVPFNMAAYQFIRMVKAAAFFSDLSLGSYLVNVDPLDKGLGSYDVVIDFRFSVVTNVEAILRGH